VGLRSLAVPVLASTRDHCRVTSGHHLHGFGGGRAYGVGWGVLQAFFSNPASCPDACRGGGTK